MENQPFVRFANEGDLPTIVDVYNQAIRSGFATGDLDTFGVNDRKEWFQKFDKDTYPIYVVEVNGKTVGYGTLSPYRPGRKAMRSIAEISFFLHEKYKGMGIGSLLVDFIIRDCARIGKKTLLAILLDLNERSISLLKKFGFRQWGYFPDVVELREKKCGQLIYGIRLRSSDEW